MIIPVILSVSALGQTVDTDQQPLSLSPFHFDYNWEIDVNSPLVRGLQQDLDAIKFDELSLSMSVEYRQWLIGELALELGDRVGALSSGEIDESSILRTARVGVRVNTESTEILLWLGQQAIYFSSDYTERPVSSSQIIDQTNEELDGKSAVQIQWKIANREHWQTLLSSLISEISVSAFNMDSGTNNHVIDYSKLDSYAIQVKGELETTALIKTLQYQLSFLEGKHLNIEKNETRWSASVAASLDLSLPTTVYSEYVNLSNSPEFPGLSSSWSTGVGTDIGSWHLMGEYTLSKFDHKDPLQDFTVGAIKRLHWRKLSVGIGPQWTHSFAPIPDNTLWLSLKLSPYKN